MTISTVDGKTVSSVAYAACAAGVTAPDAGSSASGSSASVSGVTASVTCDGTTVTVTDQDTSYTVTVKGVWCKKTGFAGAIAGQRVSDAEASC